MMRSKGFLVVASVMGGTGVALGAFGAHGLKSSITSDMLSVFETGVRYQMYHTFALFAACWLMQRRSSKWLSYAAWFFVVGVILFSGSLYVLAMTGLRSFGLITPFGGLSFLAGWFSLAWGVLQKDVQE